MPAQQLWSQLIVGPRARCLREKESDYSDIPKLSICVAACSANLRTFPE
jgi:hypothetical protein